MQIHHDKHHQAYVNNLNKAIAAHPELGKQPVEMLVKNLGSVPEDIRTAVRNNGGGHYNHSLFWVTLKKNNGAGPGGELGKDIDSAFGSYPAFKDQFTKAALGVFGSGWAWLSLDGNKINITDKTGNSFSGYPSIGVAPNRDVSCGSTRETELGTPMTTTPFIWRVRRTVAQVLARMLE